MASPLEEISTTRGRTTFGGTEMYFNKWSANCEGGNQPKTNFGSTTDGVCYQEYGEANIKKLHLTFGGLYDAANPPYATLAVGQIVQNALFYLDTTSTLNITCEAICIMGSQLITDMTGDKYIGIEYTAESSGQFTLPGEE